LQKTIVFVYNAHSDKWSKYIDYAHKIMSPSTYSCDLCSLTHGNFSEKEIWKNFRETTEHVLIFTYKDNFLKENQENDCQQYEFPVILEQKEEDFTILMNAEELNLINAVEDLIIILKERLA